MLVTKTSRFASKGRQTNVPQTSQLVVHELTFGDQTSMNTSPDAALKVLQASLVSEAVPKEGSTNINGTLTATDYKVSGGASKAFASYDTDECPAKFAVNAEIQSQVTDANGVLNGQLSNWSGLAGQKYNGYYTLFSATFGQNANGFWRDAYKMGHTRRFLQIALGDEGNNYSYMWVGWVVPNTGGTYWFQTSSNDASHVYIDNNGVVFNGGTHNLQTRAGNVVLVANQWYHIRIVYGESSGGSASMTFQWFGPDSQFNWTSNLAYGNLGTFRCIVGDDA